MMSNNKQQRARAVFAKKSSVIATEIALALMAAQIAYAQQPPEQTAPPQQPPEQAAPQQQPAAQPVRTAEQVERIEITGTRLPQVNVEGATPITTLNAQDIKFDGHAKAEDLLNQLPQVYTSQGSNTSNGATGTANVNLRNLGPTRNLVLVNGRRLPPGSPRSGSDSYAADLNQIPAPLIQRVELLTGGASAVYGSDAISGVVNFIMNDRFEGLQINVDRSFYNHHQQNPDGIADLVAARHATNPSQFSVPGNVTRDGDIKNVSLLMGSNFADNRGNATVFFSYKNEAPVLQGSRDFSSCALTGPGGVPGDVFLCGGSSTSYPGRWFLNQGTFTVADAAGNTRPFSRATDQFNFGPYNYYRRPSEQYAFSSFAHLDIIPKMRAYSEFMFHDNHTVAQIAPSGIFVGNPDFLGSRRIFFENPLLSADWRNRFATSNAQHVDPVTGLPDPRPFAAPGDRVEDLLIGRRNVEGGPRQDDIRHSSYRGVLGLKGEIFQNWNYDAYGQVGRVLYSGVYRNDFSKARVAKAMDVITNPATGQPACRSFVDGSDPNCVPYDIWRLGGVTQAAVNYLQTPGLQNGYTSQTIVGGTAASDLGAYGVKAPLAKNGVGVVFGVEQRKERLVLDTDTEFSTFDLAGQGGPTIPVGGSLDVSEYFGETRVPLIEGLPFADLLSVSASYRYSDYSTKKKTNTYGVGTEWAPVKEYRLRGSYQHAVRHANVTELFQPQGNNLFGMNADPCAGPTPSATLAQCQRTGIGTHYGDPNLNSPAGQYNFLQGGNVDLKPETADSFTLGLVFTPIRNFTGTVDYWVIKVDDIISNAPPSTLLTSCLNTGTFCNLVQRDQFGTLWALPSGKVIAINDNLGGYNTSGIDFGLNYGYPLTGLGTLGFNFLGTWLNKWEFEPIKGQGKFDCAGLFGPQCSQAKGPLPTWRHKVRGTWATPWDVQMAVTWRHINKIANETTSSNPLLAAPTPGTDRELGVRNYFDFALAWNVNKTFTLRGGINNIFDKDPPIVTSVLADPAIFGNGNTFPQLYDTLGRLVFVNAVAKF
jgi:outer membrane receptor protein involved in Fe transport